MALIIKVAEFGNPSTPGRDKITLKAEVESPISIKRNPIIIPLPGGSIVGLDLGTMASAISIAGIVDVELKELFVRNKAGSAFQVGETITGDSDLNSETAPIRTLTPSATILGASPSLTSPTSLYISGLSPLYEFFVDGETITGVTSGGTAIVNEPLPTKRRLEQMLRFWYEAGMITLTTRSGSYKVFISGMDLNLEAGLEDRYKFKIDFVEAKQGIVSPV